jgi:hypothetical protein
MIIKKKKNYFNVPSLIIKKHLHKKMLSSIKSKKLLKIKLLLKNLIKIKIKIQKIKIKILI